MNFISHPKARRRGHGRQHRLSELPIGEEAIVERVDLHGPAARRLMELGFLPGNRVTASGRAPGGDPLIFGVDGGLVALRRETAACLTVRRETPGGD
ncbi:MAG: FeoA family protein [Bryobacteraceae bacterium]